MCKSDLMEDFADAELLTLNISNVSDSFKIGIRELEYLNPMLEERFYKYISSLNSNPSFFTYYSGNKLVNMGGIETVLTEKLHDFFIVGTKANRKYLANQKKIKLSEKQHMRILRDYEKITELEKIVNKKIWGYSNDEMTQDLDLNLTYLQAIVHLIGRKQLAEFNEIATQFVSTAVGTNNFNISRAFINSSSESNLEGIIILGFEEVSSSNYVDTEDLKKFISDERYLVLIDEEQEIMINYALWVTKIIGFFFWEAGIKKFIVNPWLANMLKYIDVENLSSFEILINQQNFHKASKSLGLNGYYEKHSNSDVSSISF